MPKAQPLPLSLLQRLHGCSLFWTLQTPQGESLASNQQRLVYSPPPLTHSHTAFVFPPTAKSSISEEKKSVTCHFGWHHISISRCQNVAFLIWISFCFFFWTELGSNLENSLLPFPCLLSFPSSSSSYPVSVPVSASSQQETTDKCHGCEVQELVALSKSHSASNMSWDFHPPGLEPNTVLCFGMSSSPVIKTPDTKGRAELKNQEMKLLLWADICG